MPESSSKYDFAAKTTAPKSAIQHNKSAIWLSLGSSTKKQLQKQGKSWAITIA